MRKSIIAGNWKMFKTVEETLDFIEKFHPLVANVQHCVIVIAPVYTALKAACDALKKSNIAVAAQDLHWEKEGAWTGEISAEMIADVGCTHVIIGHSERRQYFGETNETVNKKIRAALRARLTPIVCVGERLEERENGRTEAVLREQLSQGFAGLTDLEFSPIIVAYEPVWAIGTGRTATPELAAKTHRFIRETVGKLFNPALAKELSLLYGGSVRPDNIKSLMAQPEIDGALVGGASLKPDSFAAIVNY